MLAAFSFLPHAWSSITRLSSRVTLLATLMHSARWPLPLPISFPFACATMCSCARLRSRDFGFASSVIGTTAHASCGVYSASSLASSAPTSSRVFCLRWQTRETRCEVDGSQAWSGTPLASDSITSCAFSAPAGGARGHLARASAYASHKVSSRGSERGAYLPPCLSPLPYARSTSGRCVTYASKTFCSTSASFTSRASGHERAIPGRIRSKTSRRSALRSASASWLSRKRPSQNWHLTDVSEGASLMASS